MIAFATKTKNVVTDSAESKGIKRTSNDLRAGSINEPAPLFRLPIQRKASCACGGDCPDCQAKNSNLAVSHPNDASEIEADQVADKVMQISDSGIKSPGEVKQAEEKKTISRKEKSAEESFSKPSLNYPELPSAIGETLNSSGQSLDMETLDFMESRFGSNFEQVKIHSGSKAAESARILNARAYTIGKDIVFGAGQYSPKTTEGKRLLAHELAHVTQQRNFAQTQNTVIHRQFDPGQPMADKAALRQDPNCGDVSALSVGETFVDFSRGVTYSKAFHAASGKAINVSVRAAYVTSGGQTPSYDEYFGVSVHQCCSVSDSEVRAQEVEKIGGEIKFTFTLADRCTLSTKVGNDFVYYLRIRNAGNTGTPVSISYTVS